MDVPAQHATDIEDEGDSFMPSFWRILRKPEVKNILITGCGGGFDFTHGMLIYPELKRLNKNVTIGSFSFGSPHNISEADIIWQEKTPAGECLVKKVFATSIGAARYCPEVRLCSYLDIKYPQEKPHMVYAYNARLFSVPMLTRLYEQFIKDHEIDTIIIIDGGTDSLMKGDEDGLGDPIEDCVSVTTAALLRKNNPKIKHTILLAVGFGMDRFNNVSDAESMKAVAELTKLGGFKGSISIESTSKGFQFYKQCIEHINAGQTFRSVMSLGMIAATEGNFGYQVPAEASSRVREGNLYLWPLMAMIWGFDPVIMSQRSLISKWIAECEHAIECHTVLTEERKRLHEKGLLWSPQSLPTHQETLERRFGDPGNKRDVVVDNSVDTKEEEEEEEICRLM